MPQWPPACSGCALSIGSALQSASDVYSPASGEVVEVNSSLVEDPSLVRVAACLEYAA